MAIVKQIDLNRNRKFVTGQEHWHGLETEPCHLVHEIGQDTSTRCVPLNCMKGRHDRFYMLNNT
jgi:hypothetical protein